VRGAWTGSSAAAVREGTFVEPAALVTALGTALARAGVAVPVDRQQSLVRALRLVPPAGRGPLYWTCRTTLVTGPEQLAAFDAVFAAVFDGTLDPADSRGQAGAPPSIGSEPRQSEPAGSSIDGLPGSGAPSAGTEPAAGQPREVLVPVVASAAARLAGTAFSALSPDELTEVRQLVRRLRLVTPQAQLRRTTASRRRGERLDLRRTLRAARRSGGDPVRLVHRRRRTRHRRLVLLCDVSGSMQSVTRVYLTLLQAAVSGTRAEAFVFATQLTRLTRQLAGRHPDVALARAAETAPDWAGGTLLATSLRRFLDEHGRRGLARGAVVVVLSDGWSSEPPEAVAAQMARPSRLAERIVWVNPRKAAPGFAPLVGGMAAALPYCDAFVSGHSLAALDDVVHAIGTPRTHDRRRA